MKDRWSNADRFSAELRSGKYAKCEGYLCVVPVGGGPGQQVCFWGAATEFMMANVNNHGITKSLISYSGMGEGKYNPETGGYEGSDEPFVLSLGKPDEEMKEYNVIQYSSELCHTPSQSTPVAEVRDYLGLNDSDLNTLMNANDAMFDPKRHNDPIGEEGKKFCYLADKLDEIVARKREMVAKGAKEEEV